MLTKSEFSRWKNDDATKEIFKLLQEEVEDIKNAWAEGHFKDPLVNERNVGIVEGINKVLFMEVEDGESERDSAG